jgi:eukaryotic-like serine/threonine-protein kinase
MVNDTVVTDRDNGNKHAGVAGWSVPGYTALKALGSGGSGDVVLARHNASGTLVAIKYMRPGLLSDPQFAAMFRDEAQVLAAVDDPNIVRLYEYAESPLGAAIVMELVDGVSLREILADQGQTSAEAALVVLQGSLMGLASAHRHGVVHRDYKPANVLVNGDGVSKLTDFGIAARAGDTPIPAGTWAYAPPEQFSGAPARPAGDVYAATATFYECLTGHVPFRGDTAEALWYQHQSQPVPLDPVPEPLRPLVAAGMAKAPEDRPADGTAFVTALQAIAAGAYGPDWAERGRSHLGEAALLLAALWPSGVPPAVQGFTLERVNLSRNHQESRHLWHLRHIRHLLHLRNLRGRRGLRLSPIKAAVVTAAAVAVVAAGATLAATAGHGSPPPGTLPAVTDVSPASGSAMGGTTVTITGAGLAHATRVTFGGVAGKIIADSDTKITVVSPPSTGTVGITVTAALITADPGAQITGTSPPGTSTVDIAVTTQAGTSKPAAADHFAYTAPRPAVTGVSPDGGRIAGGTTVSITGTGLADATRVTFGAAVGKITADSSTQITVTSPPGRGTVTITVTTPVGTSQPAAVGHYTYTAHPKRTQSISFTAPAPATTGGSATLSATGGRSGLPVVFSVDPASGPGVCTVSGRTVTYTAAGSCVIDANQAGNATYAAAPQVQQTITVSNGQNNSGQNNSGQNNSGQNNSGQNNSGQNNSGQNNSGQQPPQQQLQSISFTPPASGTVGGSAALSATASSGLAVAFSVDNPGAGVCTVSGSAVTYTAAGSCVIDANQAGNATYAAARQVQGTITVNGIPQSISFTPPWSPESVGESGTLAATASSGLLVVFSVDPNSGQGVCTLRGSLVTLTAAGTCVIDANQAGNATYAPAQQVQETITVNAIPQSISFTGPGYGYVGQSAALSATASSGLAVVFSVDPASGPGVCTVSGSTVTYTGAGSCVIDADQPGDGTYAAAPQVQQTITVQYQLT